MLLLIFHCFVVAVVGVVDVVTELLSSELSLLSISCCYETLSLLLLPM